MQKNGGLGLGVIQSHRQCDNSIERIRIPIHSNSASIVFEIYGVICLKLQSFPILHLHLAPIWIDPIIVILPRSLASDN